MERDDLLYLAHILDTAQGIAKRIDRVTREEFDDDIDLRDALAFRVQVIGEAASRLSPAIRVRGGEIPWKRIIGMRHRLVQDYMHIDYDILWEVVKVNIPQLIGLMKPLLNNLDVE